MSCSTVFCPSSQQVAVKPGNVLEAQLGLSTHQCVPGVVAGLIGSRTPESPLGGTGVLVATDGHLHRLDPLLSGILPVGHLPPMTTRAWAAFLTPCSSPPPTSTPPTAEWVSPQGVRGTPGHAAPCHHQVKGTGPQTKQSLYEPHREAASVAENALINRRFQHEGLGAGECVLSPWSGKQDPGGVWPRTPSPWWHSQ